VYEKTRSKGSNTPIYATQATKDIATILLSDTIKIKKAHGEYNNGDVGIQEFERSLVTDTLESLRIVEYGHPFEAAPGIRVTYYSAGHILGAAMTLVEIGNFRALFTGDFSGDGQKNISGYRLPEKLPDIDLMVCESTYAYRKTDIRFTEQQQNFIAQVDESIHRGGKVLIPAFAVGRSQEVLMLLRMARESGQLADFPIYTDGMVNQVCEIYNSHRELLCSDVKNIDGNLFISTELKISPSPFDFRRSDTALKFKNSGPCCIVASSGMLADGSRSAAYAAEMVEDPHNTILFTGYLDEESPGSKLLHANSRLKNFRINAKEHNVQAKVMPYHLSAHADLKQITSLVERVNPRQVVFVHGNADTSEPENLYSHFYKWGKENIQPLVSNNQTRIYLG
jgi:Cft2 family RNA processing exonuclease